MVKQLSTVIFSVFLYAFSGGNENYLTVVRKISSNVNPVNDHYTTVNYSFFRDSLSTVPLEQQTVKKWKKGENEVVMFTDITMVREGDKQLVIDKSDQVLVLGSYSMAEEDDQFAILLDTVVNRSHVDIYKLNSNTSMMKSQYPLFMPVTASILIYNHNTFTPQEAKLYLRTPMELENGEWSMNPRVEIRYGTLEFDNIDLPVNLADFIEKKGNNYSLTSEYANYEFINQLKN